MALPMHSMPTFNATIPSTGQKVKFRPFLVKDEKALLIAQQSEDVSVMADTLKTVIKNCVQTDLDMEKLATFDLEYMFLQIRGKSVGENVELIFQCDEDHGELNSKARVQVNIDLSKIEIVKDPEHSNKIDLFDDVGLVLKYPTLEMVQKMEGLDNLDSIFDVVAESIDMIYQGDEIFHGKEQKHSELVAFLNNLTSDQFLKIQRFYETMPKLRKEIEYNCPVCGRHHKKLLEGLNSFF